MTDNYALINDQFVLQSEASLHLNDLSIQRGYGIFDYLKTLDSRPVFLEDHLDRFYASAAYMNLPFRISREKLAQLIKELIQKNNLADSGIRLTLTGGFSPDGYTVTSPNLWITQSPLNFDEASFERGIKLITHEHQRQLPQVKTIDYLYAIYLQPLILEKKAEDVLYHNQNVITECPRANFFIVDQNGEVITPSKNILKGITRKKILGFTGLSIREGDITMEDLENASEAFITSTTKYVLPVTSINGKEIGSGKGGEITDLISQKLRKSFLENKS